MDLTIISPTTTETIAVKWIEITTPKGSFTILPGHAPMIATLSDSKDITIGLLDGTTRIRNVQSGIIHIQREHITILITHE